MALTAAADTVQLSSDSAVPAPDTATLLPARIDFPVSSIVAPFWNRIVPPSVAVEATSMLKVEAATARPEIAPLTERSESEPPLLTETSAATVQLASDSAVPAPTATLLPARIDFPVEVGGAAHVPPVLPLPLPSRRREFCHFAGTPSPSLF